MLYAFQLSHWFEVVTSANERLLGFQRGGLITPKLLWLPLLTALYPRNACLASNVIRYPGVDGSGRSGGPIT